MSESSDLDRREMVVQTLMTDDGMSQHRAASPAAFARPTVRQRPVLRDDSGAITFIQPVKLTQNAYVGAIQQDVSC